jgi:hypothetical protein
MIFLNSSKQQYFIITISKDYSSVLHVDNKDITTHIVTDLDSIKEVFNLNNNIPISLVLTDEQQENHIINASSIDELNNIMLDNLQLKYSSSTFNRAINLGKIKDTLASYEYSLITIHRNNIIDSWLNYLFTLPNKIEGIYSFPITTTSSKEYISALSKSNKDEHRLYNPDISSILLKKKLKGYKKIFMTISISLVIIIAIFLFQYK